MRKVGKNKKMTSVYLTLDQAERLKQLSEDTGAPASVYIREGIDLILDRHESRSKEEVDKGQEDHVG